jgi:putative membrane protein
VLGRLSLYALLTVGLWLWNTYGKPIPALDPLGHQTIGVALGLLIVLRTNASYDRWWEGRKLWGGMVNASRNLVRAAAAYAGPADDLANLVAAYVVAVKQNLRGQRDLSAVKDRVPDAVLARASAAANPPSILAYSLSEWIQARLAGGKIDSILARHLDSRVTELIDYQGGCERIQRTPIAFAYAVHIKQLLLLYLLSLPFVLVPRMDLVALPAGLVIAFGMLGIEEAGIEIEDPFGEDPNDLPLNDICAVIARDTAALAELAKK